MVPIIFFNIFLIFSNFLSAKCSPPPLVPALYIFGDSLFDSGNNNLLPTLAKANYFPYGLNFPGSYPTGRFTNGKTVVDFIADYLGLPYPPPRVSLLRPKSFMGYNYASGSCGILPETGKFINMVDNIVPDKDFRDGDWNLCGTDEDGDSRDDYDIVDDYDEEEDLGNDVEVDEDDDLENEADLDQEIDGDVDEVNDDEVDEENDADFDKDNDAGVDVNEGFTTPTKRNSDPRVAPPSVGMVFPRWEDVNTYYRTYGKQEGFGVVCAGGGGVRINKEVGKSDSIRGYVWKCECYGTTRYKRMVNGKKISVLEEPMIKRKSKKCNCPVVIYASRNKENRWVVKRVVNKHENHNPTPSKSKHIAMYRVAKITQTLEARIENDFDSGAPVAQIFNNISGQRNGVENVGFTKKDMHNLLNKKMRLKLRDGNAAAMLKYLDKMTKDNQNFYHMHRLDESGKLKDVMWVDARSRAACQYFGDVVCFDSTYLTNQYELPFSNFVGVNHHGQTILLGCALVSHENTETFVLLFKMWLSCMGGKAPAAIMTDQDAAIRKAIHIALPMPQTRHRWCMWHIMQKFSRKLGALTDYPQIKLALQNAIYNSLTPKEFVEEWAAAITKYELQKKPCYKWLEGLYKQREMWIPAYLKHIFWAGMQTTQRVESINSFFDGYLKKNTRLFQFAPRYCKAMESRAQDEKAADANSSRFTRPLMGEFAVERKFQKLYTDAKFVEVQVQCNRVAYLNHIGTKEVSDQVEEHTFSDRVWIWSKFLKKEIALNGRKRNYTVSFNKESFVSTCDCKHFECHRIVYRHIIKVLDMHNVNVVPATYILDRWRKDIQRKHTLVKVAYHDPSKTDEVKRYDQVMIAFEPVVLRASLSEQNVDLVLELIQSMVMRLDEKDVVTAVVGDNACGGPSSVGNRKGSDGDLNVPATPGSVNRGGKNSGASPSTTPEVAKDPIPRGQKAHRTRDKRFMPPSEKTKKTFRKQGRKNKTVEVEPEHSTTTPTPTQNHFCEPQNNFCQPQNNFYPGWGHPYVLPGYNPMIGVPPQQHLVGVNNIPPVGHMRGNVIFPQHNYIGAHLHNYQAHQPGKVGVATNLFPLVPVDYRMSMGGIRMSQDVGEAIQRSQNVSGVPMSENVGSLSYFTSNAPTLQGSENQTLTPELVSSQDLSTN